MELPEQVQLVTLEVVREQMDHLQAQGKKRPLTLSLWKYWGNLEQLQDPLERESHREQIGQMLHVPTQG